MQALGNTYQSHMEPWSEEERREKIIDFYTTHGATFSQPVVQIDEKEAFTPLNPLQKAQLLKAAITDFLGNECKGYCNWKINICETPLLDVKELYFSTPDVFYKKFSEAMQNSNCFYKIQEIFYDPVTGKYIENPLKNLPGILTRSQIRQAEIDDQIFNKFIEIIKHFEPIA